MITNPSTYRSYKQEALAREQLTLEANYRILELLYEEASRLGHFDPHDILLGLEDDIRLAAFLNANVSSAPACIAVRER